MLDVGPFTRGLEVDYSVLLVVAKYVYASTRPDWQAEAQYFQPVDSLVHLSVFPFVHLLPNLLLKTNQPLLMPIGISGPLRKGMKQSTSGGQRLTSCKEAKDKFGSLGFPVLYNFIYIYIFLYICKLQCLIGLCASASCPPSNGHLSCDDCHDYKTLDKKLVYRKQIACQLQHSMSRASIVTL